MMNLEPIFRLARPNDFDEILKLSEGVYDGHDYLPFRYHTWMKMKNVAVMLAYYGEKLVGLVACSVVDDGRTWVARAGRTLKEFRGQGVTKGILQAIRNQLVRRHFPNVYRQLLARERFNPSLRKIAHQDVLRFSVLKGTLRSGQFHVIKNSVQINVCTKEYLCDVVFSTTVAQKLFPDNIILVEKIPIKPIRSNIDFLTTENDVYFAVERCIDGALPRSVSFGLLSPRVKMVHWSVTVYTSDPVLYEAHLLHQLKRACEVIKGDFIFHSFHDKSLTNHGRRVLKEKLQVEFEEELPVNLYEEDVMQQSHL
ncbi:histidine N-acetyltransferase-like [Oculina patagonica]